MAAAAAAAEVAGIGSMVALQAVPLDLKATN